MLRTALSFQGKITDYRVDPQHNLKKQNEFLSEIEPQAGDISKGDIFVIKDSNAKEPVKNKFEVRKLVEAYKTDNTFEDYGENAGIQVVSTDLNGENPKKDEYIPGMRDFEIYTPQEFLNLTRAMRKTVKVLKGQIL